MKIKEALSNSNCQAFKNKRTGVVVYWNFIDAILYIYNPDSDTLQEIADIPKPDTESWLPATFTSYHGLPLFCGDKFWVVETQTLTLSCYHGYYDNFIVGKAGSYNDDWHAHNLVFASRQRAEEFVANVHQKHVLFRTYDGYSVFTGQLYYLIDLERGRVVEKTADINTDLKDLDLSLVYANKYAARKKLIQLQKPIYSKLDIIQAGQTFRIYPKPKLLSRIDAVAKRGKKLGES